MKRFILFILVFVLVFSLSVPAYATSAESDWLIDLLDYTAIDDDNYFNYSSSIQVTCNIPFSTQITYVDMLFSYTGDSLTNVQVGNYVAQQDLTIVSLGNRTYRAYGSISSTAPSTLYVNFISSDTVKHFVTIYSLRVGNEDTDRFPLKGSINYNVGGTWNYLHMSDPSTPITANLDISYIAAYFACYDWHGYDRIDFFLKVNAEYIDSISCQIGYQYVPFTISKIYPGFSSSNDYDLDSKGEYYIYVSCDVSSFSRDLNNALDVHISGRDYLSASYSLTLYSVTGHVNKGKNPVTFWLQKISNNITSGFNVLYTWIDSHIRSVKSEFASLTNFLKEALGFDDKSSEAAFETQEEINVSVNNQLVTAVQDWNTNISVVETGYDLAVTKTSPALVWLSSLADGIFNGMGWFGNVYFLIGLISVLMLVLSKSGLASKIGSITRRKGD